MFRPVLLRVFIGVANKRRSHCVASRRLSLEASIPVVRLIRPVTERAHAKL